MSSMPRSATSPLHRRKTQPPNSPRGHAREAIEELERIIAMTGATGENLLQLAQARLAAGDVTRAREAAERAERLGANQSATGNLQVQQFLAGISTQRGDAEVERHHRALMQFELGKVSWSENNVPQAHQQFVLATRLAPDLAFAWFYLGETSAILGDPAGARQSYERCLLLAPNHGRAVEALQRQR